MPGAALAFALMLAQARAVRAPKAMIIAPAPNREVLMIRRSGDGSAETACVDNDDAVRAFLAGAKTKTEIPKQ